jgi:nucleotide-binding universal stress UspA family protein
MRRVLVLAQAEDMAGRSVSLAAQLASREPLELFVVRVLEENSHPQPRGLASGEAERLRSLLLEAEVRELEALTEPLRGNCKELTTSVSWGVPWEVVLDLVERYEIDLVVKPARGLSHEGRVFFGATALHLFRKCPCPVWVVGDERGLPDRILAAIDPGDGETRRAVGRRIIEWSHWIARLSGAELHVATCWHAPAADVLKEKVSPEELDHYVQDSRDRAREGQQAIVKAADPPIPQDRVHLIEGDARDLLPRFARGQGFDLVVMGSLGREGLAGELLGETAELVVRALRSSVVTLSPKSRSKP